MDEIYPYLPLRSGRELPPQFPFRENEKVFPVRSTGPDDRRKVAPTRMSTEDIGPPWSRQLPSGLIVEIKEARSKACDHHYVLVPADSEIQELDSSDVGEMMVYAFEMARVLGERFFQDSGAWTLYVNGPSTARRARPHVHILVVRDAKAKGDAFRAVAARNEGQS